MENIRIIDTNPENIQDCAFCGYKNPENTGHKRKVEWLKERYPEGIHFKVLRSDTDGDVGFIEYIPGEYTWKPVNANGFMVIHCLLIMKKKYKGKGYGGQLLNCCIEDTIKEKLNGIVVISSKGSFMVDKDLFIKNGFEIGDTAKPHFELLYKKFKKSETPKFTGNWENNAKKYGHGVSLIRSGQCPYTDKNTDEIIQICKSSGFPIKVIELKTSEEARNMPSPFGVFNIVINGQLVADHPISSTRFKNIIKKMVSNQFIDDVL